MVSLRETLRGEGVSGLIVVFFDIDDTLIDHSTAMRRATERLYHNLSLTMDLDGFLREWRRSHREYYPRFLRGEISYEQAARGRVRGVINPNASDVEADEMFNRYLADYESEWRLFPDVMECLNALRGYRLGVISNGRSDEQRRKLVNTGIKERFEPVVVSESCGYAKPSPEIFRIACDTAGVAPTQAVYIGDQYELDARAATDAGLRGVWLNRSCESISDGFASIGSLHEVVGLLEQRPAI